MAWLSEDEVYVGRDFGGREVEITPDLVQHFVEAVEDRNPWYSQSSPFGGSVAPAFLLCQEVYRSLGWYLSAYGNLHIKQEWELFQPMMVGDHITSRSVIIDRYVKRDREQVVKEVSYLHADGRLLSRSRTYQSFLIGQPAEGMVVDKDRDKSSGRRFDVGKGDIIEEIPPVSKEVTLAMCQRFSGPAKSYHTDKEQALKLGFPDIVVEGMLSTCFLSEMMTRRFGPGWYVGGRATLNLVNILWGDETVTARGVIKELTPEGSRQRAHCEVWCEKPDGAITIVGTASAVV
jgi:hypothetical protein